MEVPLTTPANTIGMGNPDLGSGDNFIPADKPKKKKMTSLKDYIKNKKNK